MNIYYESALRVPDSSTFLSRLEEIFSTPSEEETLTRGTTWPRSPSQERQSWAVPPVWPTLKLTLFPYVRHQATCSEGQEERRQERSSLGTGHRAVPWDLSCHVLGARPAEASTCRASVVCLICKCKCRPHSRLLPHALNCPRAGGLAGTQPHPWHSLPRPQGH